MGGVGGGQLAGEPVQAHVDVRLGGLHQPVGGQREDRAGLEPEQGHRELCLGEHTERRAALGDDDLGRAVRVAQHGRQMAGADAPGGALLHVGVDVAAGGEEVGLHLEQQPVRQGDDHVRGVALGRVGAQGGAHLAHQGGRARVVPLDVADDEGHVAVGERDHVVPVAADLVGRLCGPVPAGDLQAGQAGRGGREQAALQGLGRVAHALVRAGVVDAHRGAGGQLDGDGEVVLVEGPWIPGAGQPQETEDGASGGERDGHVGMHPGTGEQQGRVLVAGDA